MFYEARNEPSCHVISLSQVYAKFQAEHFDLAIAHFHDLCPLAIAEKIGVKKVIWITHGTSIYDFAAVQLGLRTQPATIPHPLSSCMFYTFY
ncbi:unnamed protein product [Nippostrongylus brasiliensis]|uniref:Glyco_trans_4-like_N domain-containing protein n=1 Tax=Nippostrongylus brasiliensis TaxID=27835 RepID=A0A0N4XK77_NIPBR|nr:unnamed protein product [Nippostrongylus brasiliensis]